MPYRLSSDDVVKRKLDASKPAEIETIYMHLKQDRVSIPTRQHR